MMHEFPPLFTTNRVRSNGVFDLQNYYCPLCEKSLPESKPLFFHYSDEKPRWIANMILHYKYDHITYWKKCCGKDGDRYRGRWFKDFETEEYKVNEKAKRVIINKATAFLKFHGISGVHFNVLPGTSMKTLELASLKLK